MLCAVDITPSADTSPHTVSAKFYGVMLGMKRWCAGSDFLPSEDFVTDNTLYH